VPHLIAEIQRASRPFRGNLPYHLSSWLYDYAPEVLLAWIPEPIPASERRLNAVILLGELGPLAHEAVPVLIPLLEDEDLQCSIVFTLQAIGPAARLAVPKMIQLLRDEPELRLATALADLAPDDPEVIRTLVEVSRTGTGDVRREAATALRICAAKLASSLALLKSETAGIDSSAARCFKPASVTGVP
jgi:HEAT repeat protein